jgi:GNAT superfamily N-acetyltransferase
MHGIKYAGYYPGLIGDMVKLHGCYYAEHHGYDLSFEAQEAQELGEFGLNFKPTRDCWRSARHGDRFVGSVVIDGRQHPQFGARLRWFIVDPAFQGQGVGWKLLSDAVVFSTQLGFEQLYLMTVKGLDAARRLYEKIGFSLDHEYSADQWGLELIEQRYILKL